MRRILVPALLFVMALVIFLLAEAPARLAGLFVPEQRVTLQGFEGTLWRGSAGRMSVSLPQGRLQLGRVDWRLRPLSLLTFSPRIEVHSEWGGQRISGDITLAGTERYVLRDVEVHLAADVLRHFAPVEVAGTLQFSAPRLEVAQQRPVTGEGRLVWLDAAWEPAAGRMSLGSYALDWSQQEGEPLRGDVLTLEGPVQASGTVRLNGDSYSVNVSLEQPGGLDPRLARSLSLIAAPEGDRLRIAVDGQLR